MSFLSGLNWYNFKGSGDLLHLFLPPEALALERQCEAKARKPALLYPGCLVINMHRGNFLPLDVAPGPVALLRKIGKGTMPNHPWDRERVKKGLIKKGKI